MRLIAHNLITFLLLTLLSLFFSQKAFAETTPFRSANIVTTDTFGTLFTNLNNCSATDGLTCDRVFANSYGNLYFRDFGTYADFGMQPDSKITQVRMRVTGKASTPIYVGVSVGTTFMENCQWPTDLWGLFLNSQTISTQNFSTPVIDAFQPGAVRSYCFTQNLFDTKRFIWRINFSSSQPWSANIDNFEIAFDYIPGATPTPIPTVTKTAVIFIPGIGGSELKTTEDTYWIDKDDGHGGTYSHAYASNEKIWVNRDEAVKLGDDDYFDVLRLKSDGVTSEAGLSLTGNLTSFGYGDIDSFFQGLGYVKGTDFFVFPYDWRKDVRLTKDSLDSLVEEAKTKSGKSKVNIVAHSMGGLVARYYTSDSSKAAKVDNLIELGVPHLGSVDSLKTLRYGSWLGYDFKLFTLGIPPNETKDVSQNTPSIFQLLPSTKYYDFYNNSAKDVPFPIRDDRDVDNNKVTGLLNFAQVKSLLTNLTHNMTVFAFGEQFHDDLDQKFNQSNGVHIYFIVGSNQPTLGQIHETWWIKWPINLIPKTDEIFINGDGTVPLYSASLKGSSLDLSGGATIYYTDQNHGDLVKNTGQSMQIVKSILATSPLPLEVKSQKIDLEGKQISINEGKLDLYDDGGNHTGLKSDGEIEINIPNTFYSAIDNNVNVFIKKTASNVKVQVSPKDSTITTDIKLRFYQADQITKTTLYKDVSIPSSTKAEFDLNPNTLSSPTIILGSQTMQPTAEVLGSTSPDQVPPKTTIKKDDATVTLSATDEGAGVLKIEYSLDDGKTVKTYEAPFTITASGKTIIQVKAIDKLGNQEIPQETIVEVASSESSSGSSPSTSSGTSEASGSKTTQSVKSDSTQSTQLTSQSNSQPQGKQIKKAVLGSASSKFPKITVKSFSPIMEQIMFMLILLPNTLPGLVSGLSVLSSFRK